MKKVIYISFLILLGLELHAQQVPITSQPLGNAYYYNPAAAGVQSYMDLSFGARQQWTGITNAPQSYFAYFNTALGKKTGPDFSYLSLPISNPSYYENRISDAPKVKHALGGKAFSDRYGAFAETGGAIDYAIHLPLNEKLYLALGLGLQFSSFSFDRNKGQVALEGDQTYQQFLAGNDNSFLMNARAGAYLYGEHLRVGYAALQLVNNRLSDANNDAQGQRIHHFINASYRISNDSWGITPNTSFLISAQQPFNALGGLLMDYKQKIMISAAYRNEGVMVLGAGLLFFDIVRATYTYDLPLSGQHIYQQGSHEVILKFMLNKKEEKDEK